MLCVVLCGVCRCGRGVVGGRGVCLVCVFLCLCVCVEARRKNLEKPVCCVETCARGAGTHGDVLNVHTETF